VLALPSASGRTIHRVQALWALGGLAYWQLDHPAVLSAYREALEISEEIGDAHAIAESTYNMAYVSLLEGDRIEARARFREARAGFEKLGDARGLADALFGLSIMGHLTGDLTASRESAEQGLLLHRELGDLFGVEGSMFALGRAVAEMGDLETAHSLFLEALDAVELMGEQTAMAVFLDNMADLEIVRGRPLRAMRIAGASEGIKDTVGGEAPPEVLAIRDLREAARQTLTEEEIAEAWAEGRRMSQEEALAYAREPI
jgi:tetratricopeptide (TPR) repeat protein